MNKISQTINVIKIHLWEYGFLTTYTKWHHHGEPFEEGTLQNIQESSQNEEDQGDDLVAGIHDAIDGNIFDIRPSNDVADDLLPHEGIEYDKLFESLQSALCDDYKEFLALSFIIN